MAGKSTETAKQKVYTVKVKNNMNFCGVDVAGVQFAHGEAQVTDEWIAEWYRTHEGYEVTEADSAEEAPGNAAAGK